ncbi:SphA family protein [Caulobacter sp. Root1455]|uniref:SphA family protein n=1 Tax=Caulobacter sp. Root1455 TaxID=1736465 RepID=UPI0009E9F1B8|nr:transporter [Caulobacter sp. Root1455]
MGQEPNVRSAARRLVQGLGVGLSLALAAGAHQAQASESGASLYLLGSGGPGNAVMPPLRGVFFDNELYYYKGSLSGAKQLPLGGNVVAGVDADILADFATVLWVPTTDLHGVTVGLGAALPVGNVDVDADVFLTGPRGAQVGGGVGDSATVIGDPIATAMLGWSKGNVHYQVSTMLNVPIGDYRKDELANLAFHRWALDSSFAVSWHDPKSGWDVSGKAGLTLNGENPHTDYTTGTEMHLEAAIEKTFSPRWSAGLQSYYFKQVSTDRGPGAVLGPFQGEVTGVGATAAYTFKIGHMPATLRARAFTEFNATNRMEGDSFWLGLTVPLSLKMPAAPPP